MGAGYPNPGTWRIRAGKYKGRAIETAQREKFKCGQEAEAKIDVRRGIVSFFNIYNDENAQGFISIVAKDRWGYYMRCGLEIDGTATGCYWTSKEVWFWPLL